MHTCTRAIVALVVSSAALVGCATSAAHVDTSRADTTSSSGAAMAAVGMDDQRPLNGPIITLWVLGMSCPKCVSNIDITLRQIPGVAAVGINMKDGVVTVTLNEGSHPTRGRFAKAVDDAGLTLVRIEETP